jgi:hypothetical protein
VLVIRAGSSSSNLQPPAKTPQKENLRPDIKIKDAEAFIKKIKRPKIHTTAGIHWWSTHLLTGQGVAQT